MICPHCKANTAREVHVMPRQDSLSRQNGGSGGGYISGISCLCGYWRDIDVPAVCEVPPRVVVSGRGYDPAAKLAIYHIVVKFYDSITEQRKAGVSWYTVAQLLNQAGHKCQEKTLQKYFLIEHDKRCDSGKTA